LRKELKKVRFGGGGSTNFEEKTLTPSKGRGANAFIDITEKGGGGRNVLCVDADIKPWRKQHYNYCFGLGEKNSM